MKRIREFLSNNKDYPLLAALAAGLYPMFFYYTNNFTLVNTWSHFAYFCAVFITVPLISFYLFYKIFGLSMINKWQPYVLPFLNLFVFLFLMKVALYAGMQKKMIVGIFVLSLAFSWFLYRHYKKVIVFQLLLAVIGLITFTSTLISQINFSDHWMEQVDDIAQVTFKKKPNVYFIQPDGYVNFSEIGKGYYNIDNSHMEQYLLDNGFTNYANFRSNYGSTLSSNSSVFMMKHHYYNKGTSFSEGINARNVIVSNNTVVDAFNNNGYHTHLILEKPYLLLSRPEIAYDEANFKYEDIPFISSGLKLSRDVVVDLETAIVKNAEQPHFYFVEFFNPGHISNSQFKNLGVDGEKEKWLGSLDRANKKLTNLVAVIKRNDPNALVVILADHGGYLGYNYSNEANIKTDDINLVNSIFSTQLSIHWPQNAAPKFDSLLKSNINVFRILFSYLSEDEKYLQHLQDDSSYMIIYQGAPKGVYKLLDEHGDLTFKKH